LRYPGYFLQVIPSDSIVEPWKRRMRRTGPVMVGFSQIPVEETENR